MNEADVHAPMRILVVQPSWVGDAVMATPALRALRQNFPQAHISYLLKRYVRGIYRGMPWANRLLTYRGGGHPGIFKLASRLRAGKFDMAVLFSNSFRTALLCKLAGIPRVVGYARDARSMLLTDGLPPLRNPGLFSGFTPTPMVGSYLRLIEHLGAIATDRRLELFVTPADRAVAQRVMSAAGISDAIDRPGHVGAKPLIMLNVGAQYGSAKCWPAKYFADISDRCHDQLQATVLVSGSPKELQIIDEIRRHTKHAFVDLARLKPTLGSLKEIVRRCDLMVTNDTGPRHIAAAMGTPVVTLFGPTHQAWTKIDFQLERALQIPVICGPCQKKTCPLDHRCMTRLTPELVWPVMLELLGKRTSLPVMDVGDR